MLLVLFAAEMYFIWDKLACIGSVPYHFLHYRGGLLTMCARDINSFSTDSLIQCCIVFHLDEIARLICVSMYISVRCYFGAQNPSILWKSTKAYIYVMSRKVEKENMKLNAHFAQTFKFEKVNWWNKCLWWLLRIVFHLTFNFICRCCWCFYRSWRLMPLKYDMLNGESVVRISPAKFDLRMSKNECKYGEVQ